MSKSLYQFQCLGSDVEVFLMNNSTKKLQPCIQIFGGTKESPIPITKLGKGFAVQEDNVMLEFNIPPARTEKEWGKNFFDIIQYLAVDAKQKGFSLLFTPHAQFLSSQLTHPQAHHIGCMPDICAWTKTENYVDSAQLGNMRVSGGHLHISFLYKGRQIDSPEPAFALAKMLDLTCAIPSVLMDQSNVRRQWYGKAGSMRFTEYTKNISGIEYRVLSNFWVRRQDFISWVFKSVQQAFSLLNQGIKISPAIETAMVSAINNGNTKIATNLVKWFNLDFPDVNSSRL